MDKELMEKLFEDMPKSFKEKKEEPNDTFLPVLLSLLLFSSSDKNIALDAIEKELAYLRGKVDTLEKIVFVS